MKQLVHYFKDGKLELLELPMPTVENNSLLIKTRKSLLSSGTERMLIEFGQSNLFQKALNQPDRVKQVLNKIKSEGLASTIESVTSKMSLPANLGYSNVGEVIAVGNNISEFRIGDRVVSNGPHAEIVSVSKNLCEKIPDSVSDDQAVFTIMAAIALNGLRLSEPSIGEVYVVIGAGLIGLIAVQLLVANGCSVYCVDYNKERLALSEQLGAVAMNANNPDFLYDSLLCDTQHNGADGVLICSSSNNSAPLDMAVKLCKKRGRIILVGVCEIVASRDEMYKKEISFQVACSYGPGRYDSNYEDKAVDYPFAYVRWTEKRNFSAILQLIKLHKLDFSKIISHKFQFSEATKAYELLMNKNCSSLGVVLEYSNNKNTGEASSIAVLRSSEKSRSLEKNSNVKVGVIGAGNYSGRVLIPLLHKSKASIITLANSGSANAVFYARKYNIPTVTTDTNALLADESLNAVIIATRHDSHAQLVCDALQKNKHVFVEKPLCLTETELKNIKKIHSKKQHLVLMVGFNRRFSPFVTKLKDAMRNVTGPINCVYTINAGILSKEHWLNDNKIGGSRILGEVCHFVDLMNFIMDATIIDFKVLSFEDDLSNIHLILKYEDGSLATINYLTNGHQSYPKERLEVFANGKILKLVNFRTLKSFGWSGVKNMKTWRQEKGQEQCMQFFLDAVSYPEARDSKIMTVDSLFQVSKNMLKIFEDIRT